MQAPQVATSHHAGEEPLPGYRLVSPLGQGGFGEVWKCEAPGGFFKAIKFVRPDTEGSCTASQERAALERIKLLRHPFILTLERVEEHDGELVVVMELADESLYALQGMYREKNASGVPRDELLSYMHEVAEALDWLNFEHGLQHLDIKPHNLFLISGHVKVADFGLVHHLGDDAGETPARRGGVTPLYSAPEMLRGTLSRHSDQYSLAVVYQQLLTGTVPFWHENVYELMMQHLCGEPDLLALPEADRPSVARALAKAPEQRFGSCLEFVEALVQGDGSSLQKSGKWRRVLLGKPPSAPTSQANPLPASPSRSLAPAGINAAPPETQRQMTETPTRRIRTLTPAQLAAAADLGASPIAMPRPAALRSPSPAVAPAPSPADDGNRLPEATAVSLPGYRFVSCVNQSQLSDQWRAEDSTGRPMRAQCLLGFVKYDARLISHFKALRDRALPPTEVHWSPAERLVLLTSAYQGTLRDRFEQRQLEGSPGIPRLELLAMLRTAAEALDSLAVQQGLQHLGLHPRNLLVQGMRLWVADFGLIPLVWLPAGHSAATLNGRYAAPELFDRRPSRSADQYSLALIFTEMLTGIHPRPTRPNSGVFRRPGSGVQPKLGTRQVKIDLGLLPAPDREVVARALADDPAKRFDSCTEFIEALEVSGSDPVLEDLYAALPPVIPYASLMGESSGPEVLLPAIPQLVTELVNAERETVEGPANCRYSVHPDSSWEYRCPIQLFPGAMSLKVEGLRTHWNASIASQDGDSYVLHIELETARISFWSMKKLPPRKLEIGIAVEPATDHPSRLTEAVIAVRFLGESEQSEKILANMAPKIFDSARTYLQAAQEQRTRERWPLTQPLRVYPVLPDLETAPTIDGSVRNISFGGIGFLVPKKPATEFLYLHLFQAPQALGYAILARILRVREVEGGYEIGCAFVEPVMSESILE
jgi:serine/threonine protein kinase